MIGLVGFKIMKKKGTDLTEVETVSCFVVIGWCVTLLFATYWLAKGYI